MNIISKDHLKVVKQAFLTQSGLDESVFDKEVSFAVQIAQKNPYLQKCTPESALKAILNVAQVGLTLNPVKKESYLIPRYNSSTKQMEVCLDPSYIGLIKLVTDAGGVSSINSQLIYEGDEIEISLGDEKPIKKHIPYFLVGKEKGDIIGCYSRAVLTDKTEHVEIMSRMDVLEVRSRSESYKAYTEGKIKSTTWVTDEGEMFRKTVVKRHTKYLPKSTDSEHLQNAIELSHQAMGFQEPLTHGYWAFVESKLERSTLTDDEKTRLADELADYKFMWQAKKLDKYLTEYQPESLDERFNRLTE
jgi:recombination protein RecT